MGHTEFWFSIVSSCCSHNWHLLQISSFEILFLKRFFTSCLVLSCCYCAFCLSLLSPSFSHWHDCSLSTSLLSKFDGNHPCILFLHPPPPPLPLLPHYYYYYYYCYYMALPIDFNTFPGLALFSSLVKEGEWTYRFGPLEKFHFFFPLALRPYAGHGLLILEVSRSHTTTRHSR